MLKWTSYIKSWNPPLDNDNQDRSQNTLFSKAMRNALVSIFEKLSKLFWEGLSAEDVVKEVGSIKSPEKMGFGMIEARYALGYVR